MKTKLNNKEEKKIRKELVEFHRAELGSLDAKINQITAEMRTNMEKYKQILGALEVGKQRIKETILLIEGE